MRSIIATMGLALFFSCQNSQPNIASMTKLHDGPTEPAWVASANIYELNTRQFSPEGNFAGVEKQLPRLKSMGVDVVWLMPIHPISVKNRKGSLGSAYAVQDYKKVNPDFGTMDDFRRLVKKAHEIDLKLIIDWVPNHTGWDHVWLTEKPSVYTLFEGKLTVPLNERGEQIHDWSDVCDLDYSKPETRAAMIEAMSFWVKTADIDGFRCDMSGLVADDFWPECRAALDKIKPLFMLSEWQDAPSHFTSFNANYGWKWKDFTKEIAAGKRPANDLDSLLADLQKFYPKHFYQVYFTQNHDENSWNGTAAELYQNQAAADCFAALACTWQGMPLVYCGQEDDLAQRLKFFERDPIQWKSMGKTTFFQTIFALKHQNRALDAGLAGGPLVKILTQNDRAVYAFSREKNGQRVVGIFNLTGQNQPAKLKMNGLTGSYENVFGHATMEVMTDMNFEMKPWEFILLEFKK